MAVDGFSPSEGDVLRALDPNTLERFCQVVARVRQTLGVEVEGIARVPKGRALLVANHAFGFDVAFPMEAIHREAGRVLWPLGEHVWWGVPFVRGLAARLGVVDGTQANADHLLQAEQLVMVLPGG